MMDYREDFQKCNEYIKALEEERRKIEIFQRELPLCLDLVTQAIEKYKQQLSGNTTDCTNGQSDCSEQTICDEGPLFEEFMPIKESCSSAQQVQEEGDEDGDELNKSLNNSNKFNNINDNEKSCSGKKSDWLRSAQLWNQSPNPPTTTHTNEENQSYHSKRVKVVEVKLRNGGGAFKPFKKENADCDNTGAASICCTVEKAAGGGCRESAANAKKDEARKARRCWSPELHRRFLNALQQLGGSHVATPKQIRELMKMDGLTNDEVKSHLQKYRLHTRRPTPAIQSNANTQAPQFVLVGGIFYSPAASSSTLATTASTTQPTSSGSLMIQSQPVSLESESI